jgi:uncharacterized membrane protein
MAHLITGLFIDSKQAGEAVAELKGKGYTEELSVASRDENTGEASTTSVQSDGGEGAAAGATTGAAIGGLSALLAGLTSIVIPGAGILVAGPLATALTTAAAGAAAGGIVGALVDKGIPDNVAKTYEEKVKEGEVLAPVTADHDNEEDIKAILSRHNVTELNEAHAQV